MIACWFGCCFRVSWVAAGVWCVAVICFLGSILRVVARCCLIDLSAAFGCFCGV